MRQLTLKEAKFCNTTFSPTFSGLLSFMKPSSTKSFLTITMRPEQGEARYWKSLPSLTTDFFCCASLYSFAASLGHIQHTALSGVTKGRSPGQGALRCFLPLFFMDMHDHENMFPFISTRGRHLHHHFFHFTGGNKDLG